MLELSTKYALAVISYLSDKQKAKNLIGNEPTLTKEFVRVKEIAQKTKIPQAYLSKVVKILVSNKLVESKAGAGGGIRLPIRRKKPISIYDVCQAMEDPICNQDCFLNKTKCDPKRYCLMHSSWKQLKQLTLSVLTEPKF